MKKLFTLVVGFSDLNLSKQDDKVCLAIVLSESTVLPLFKD